MEIDRELAKKAVAARCCGAIGWNGTGRNSTGRNNTRRNNTGRNSLLAEGCTGKSPQRQPSGPGPNSQAHHSGERRRESRGYGATEP